MHCSVKTDLLKDGAVSRLYIARASKTDSGNYTCGMRNAQTSVTVHILNGKRGRRERIKEGRKAQAAVMQKLE